MSQGLITKPWQREALAIRREARRMEAAGYRKHETDWEIHRGSRIGDVIADAKISVCGGYVWTKLGHAPGQWKVEPGTIMPRWLRIFNEDHTWRMADGLSVPGARFGDINWSDAGIDVSTASGLKHAAIGDWIVFDGARFDVRHADSDQNQKR